MRFKTSAATQTFIEDTCARLGATNPAVLGRSGLFLALGEGVPPEFKPKDAQGKELNEETVVDDELRAVIRAALNFRAGEALDEEGYKLEFRRHFEFGCQRLREIWENSGRDQTRFVGELLKLCALGPIVGAGAAGGAADAVLPIPVVEAEVKLRVLADALEWSVNGPGTNNGLLVISGGSGSGKTQLALDLLAQLARQSVRFVFFDLKGELEDDPDNALQRETRTKFLSQTGARYVRLIQQDLPINPLWRDRNDTANAQIAYEIASLIAAFAPQLGAKQIAEFCDAYTALDNDGGENKERKFRVDVRP